MYSCDGFINIQVPDPLEVGAAGPLGGFIWLFNELFFWLKAWTVFAVANKVVKPYLPPTRQKLLPFIFFSLLLVFILYPFSTLMSFIIIIINSYHLKKSLDVPSWRHLKGRTGTMHWVCVPTSTSLCYISFLFGLWNKAQGGDPLLRLQIRNEISPIWVKLDSTVQGFTLKFWPKSDKSTLKS